MTTEMFEGPDGLLYANPAECVDAWAHEATSLRAALAEAERDISRLDYLQSISVDSAELFPDMPRSLVILAPYDGDRALSEDCFNDPYPDVLLDAAEEITCLRAERDDAKSGPKAL